MKYLLCRRYGELRCLKIWTYTLFLIRASLSSGEFDMSFVTWQILSSFKRCLIKPDHAALNLLHPTIFESLLIVPSPSLYLRLKTSCTTWYQTWTSGARTWKRGLRSWRPNWKRCSATYRHFQASSVRWSASNTGTSWRCNSSPTTNTATTAHSPSPGADRLPPRHPLPPRAARAVSPAGVSGEDFRHHMAKLHFTVKPYDFNKVLSKFWWHHQRLLGIMRLKWKVPLVNFYFFNLNKWCCFSGDRITERLFSVTNDGKISGEQVLPGDSIQESNVTTSNGTE